MISVGEHKVISRNWLQLVTGGKFTRSNELTPTQIIYSLAEKQNVNIFENMSHIHKRQSLTVLEN